MRFTQRSQLVALRSTVSGDRLFWVEQVAVPTTSWWQIVPTARAVNKTTKTAMHAPHDGTRLLHRSMRVGDAPPTGSRSRYVPEYELVVHVRCVLPCRFGSPYCGVVHLKAFP